MLLHYPSFLFLFFLLKLPMTFSASKPGCGTRCGGMEISYPFGFGLGSNCSIDPWFDIHCNTSTHPPKPYLSTTGLEVIEIFGSRIRVKFQEVAFTCFNTSIMDIPFQPMLNMLEYSRFSINLTSTPYTLSDTNQLTAFGCDDLATVALQGAMIKEGYGDGCVAYCSGSNDSRISNGYCPGKGCCQAIIPKGTNVLSVSLSDSHRNWRSTKLFPCNFAFIMEKGNGSRPEYVYDKSNLYNSFAFLNNNPMVTSRPLVLDWRIGSENCSTVMQNSTAYVCQKNSICVDSDAGAGGYLCNCMEGFQGNPYLSPGCLDIDECEGNPCHSGAICTNTPGSFHCSCPQGYYGDGKPYGIGCLPVPGSHSLPTAIKVSIGLASGIGTLLVLSFTLQLRKLLQRRKEKSQKEKFFKRNGGLLLQQQISSTNEGALGQTKHFSATELEKATDHFNENRVLGRGGQGTVYKGMLSDGKIVAVKKSQLVDENQLEQFINEVVILSQINHRNVVRLLGYCLETEVPLLVYEYVPNGTLFNLIHDENTEFPFTWNMRLKIGADVAGALAYLHSATSLPIFHRDIKSSNILLDEKYVAKVSDFGTSKTIQVDQTHLTTLVKGTFGYLDPEYFQSNQFTEKSDVYSFGVVLVELLTGQRPISSDQMRHEKSLATRFLQSMEENDLESILDPKVLSQRGIKKEVIMVARLAQRCLNLNGKKRPTMKEVAIELENVVRMSRM